MALTSASSSRTPSAASSAVAAMAATALASRKAAPRAGGRLSCAGAGLPSRPVVAAGPAVHPPTPGVDALSTQDTACAASDPRCPGLMDGGLGSLPPPWLGCLPSLGSTDAAPSCVAPSTPTPTAAVGASSPTTAGAATLFLAPAEAPPSPPTAVAEATSTASTSCDTSSSATVEPTPSSTPTGTTLGLDTERSVSWSSLADKEEDKDDDELAPQTPPSATKSSVPATRSDGTCGGWQEVLPRRNVQRPDSPVPALAPRPVPAWLRGRCCRCLLPGHRAAVCRDHFRYSRCLENGHQARECPNAWRPLSFLESPTVSPLPRLPIRHQQAPAPRKVQKEASPLSKTSCRDSWASIIAAPAGFVASTDIPVRPALERQAELLRSELLGMASF
uniref:CCHC-type domain-containing protein n=1 Tax=Triticum urartu TaxID=4572 RepID=A0A8R7NZH9_TRIUA